MRLRGAPQPPGLLLAVERDRGFVAAEERTLGARFGDAWTRYRQRVQRWL